MAAPRPKHAHATARPATATPLPRPAHTTTGWRQDRRPVVSKRPLPRLAAAKMSPHIHIGPEPVLAAHARSLPAAGIRCPAGADSAPHSEQNFFLCVCVCVWSRPCIRAWTRNLHGTVDTNPGASSVTLHARNLHGTGDTNPGASSVTQTWRLGVTTKLRPMS
jgi:hypothetical protein